MVVEEEMKVISLISYHRLLKKKRMDESLNHFLEIKRGAAMHTLESLMMLPVSDVLRRERSVDLSPPPLFLPRSLSLPSFLPPSLPSFLPPFLLSFSLSLLLPLSFPSSPPSLSPLSPQVQRVSEYDHSLSQLLALTSRDHPDYHHLTRTVDRTKEVRRRRRRRK